ncbi:MAG: IS30 family transposase [Candidatus Pacebacteria bacterium]|jgi:IS30 family transposase|nr:IS30 family transposase [Candidatus Paceibacterota bacterium]
MKKETHRKRKKRRPFRHLNQFDRDRIEAMKNAGHTQEEIAKILGFDASAVSREIRKRKRKNGVYSAKTAQHKAQQKRSESKHRGMKIEAYPQLREQIIRELKKHRSPDEIAGRMKRKKQKIRVGTNAIYKWLYSAWGQAYCHLLCTQHYHARKQKKKTKREMIPNRVSLEKRPKRGIHAEGDLFVSPTSCGSQNSGAIFCVPVSKLLAGTMIENKKPATMTAAVKSVTSDLNIDDLTFDNGIENKEHEQFGLPAYFCEAHQPWQKPHVENGIGLLRRWFIPKKTDLKNVPKEQFQEYLHILNGKWRKSLGYRSAYEVSLKRGIIQKIPR